jgi:hypothetical protein
MRKVRLRRKAAEHQQRAVPKGKQRKALKPGKIPKMGKMKPGKQNQSPAVMRKKQKAGRYPGMKCLSRNVPVKKNAHSIPLIKTAKYARGITAYASM